MNGAAMKQDWILTETHEIHSILALSFRFALSKASKLRVIERIHRRIRAANRKGFMTNQPTPDAAIIFHDAERNQLRATLQYVTGQLIKAGLDDGASPVEKMARRAVELRKERDQLRAENTFLLEEKNNQ